VRSSFVYDKACLEATTKAQPTPDGSKQVIPVRLAAEQVKKIAKQVQKVTGKSVELAYVDQGYTGDQAANEAVNGCVAADSDGNRDDQQHRQCRGAREAASGVPEVPDHATYGFKPVSLVAVDDAWSAMRFKKA